MKKKFDGTILSAEGKGIDRLSRLHYLEELEEEINNFYIPYNQVIDKPYSCHELDILVRIIKKLIRQLIGTDKFRLFSKRVVARKKSVNPKMEQELRNQRTDEIRLEHTRLTLYNPISEKYKAEKERLLRELDEM